MKTRILHRLATSARLACFLTLIATTVGGYSATGTRTAARAFNASLGVGNNFMAAKAMLHQGAPEDYTLLQTSGFNHCRIGYKLDEVAGAAPDFTIPAAEMQNLQNMVDWCIGQGLIAVIDPLHDWCNNTSPDLEFKIAQDLPKMAKIWEQVATHFAGYSTNAVCFEIINEPHDDHDVAQMIATALPAIRGVAGNAQRMVIVSGDGFSTGRALIDALNTDEIPHTDDYLVATFHYYEPMSFTKQQALNQVGTTWGTPAEYDQTVIDMQAVVLANNAWAARHGTDPLPIYMGEFGVDRVAPVTDRENWLSWVAQVAVDYGFSMAHWNMYSAIDSGKGMGPWDTIQRTDPGTRTFDSNIVAALMNGKTPSGTNYPFFFEVAEDVSAKQAAPDTNQGTAYNLEIRKSGASTFARVPYLKFQVAGLARPIQSVMLRVPSNTETDPINVLSVADTTWTETGLTWNNRPPTGALLGTIQGAAGGWLPLDLTSTVTGNGTYAIALDEQGNTFHYLYARESGAGAYLEVLTEPPSLNQPPYWTDGTSFNQAAATEDIAYSSWINWRALDPESDPLTFAKVSGPAWASIATNGNVTGTPAQGDVGTGEFIVSVSDGINPPVEATMNITVTPATPACHVSNIAMSTGSYGGGRKSGIATITIVNGTGSPVANATVSVTWTGAAPGSGNVVTNGSGVAVSESAKVKGGGTFTVTVTSVAAAGHLYNPALNVETSDTITH